MGKVIETTIDSWHLGMQLMTHCFIADTYKVICCTRWSMITIKQVSYSCIVVALLECLYYLTGSFHTVYKALNHKFDVYLCAFNVRPYIDYLCWCCNNVHTIHFLICTQWKPNYPMLISQMTLGTQLMHFILIENNHSINCYK